jgi:predicted enzyme related to lactoylglutathione lyase
MPDRNEYPPGVPCWADTSQKDPDAAADFYRGLFGWEFEQVTPEGANERYLIGRLRGRAVAAIGSLPENGPPSPVWNTYIAVDSADAAASRAREAGGTVAMGPFDVTDAGRMAVLADPEGAVHCVWEAKRSIGAEVVNEPNAVSFNGLHTRDPEGAAAYYGAVFGWVPADYGDGVQLWRLPGYGDHLEKHDPGLRQRLAEGGAPAGFEDVVATLNPIPDDQPDTPPHWSVTFGVEDADATAARATELGAKLVVPPTDVPWVRMTVIADPQGAMFIASQYKPENAQAG